MKENLCQFFLFDLNPPLSPSQFLSGRLWNKLPTSRVFRGNSGNLLTQKIPLDYNTINYQVYANIFKLWGQFREKGHITNFIGAIFWIVVATIASHLYCSNYTVNQFNKSFCFLRNFSIQIICLCIFICFVQWQN